MKYLQHFHGHRWLVVENNIWLVKQVWMYYGSETVHCNLDTEPLQRLCIQVINIVCTWCALQMAIKGRNALVILEGQIKGKKAKVAR